MNPGRRPSSRGRDRGPGGGSAHRRRGPADDEFGRHVRARRGEVGVLTHLASFFKSPMGTPEHDFFKQFTMLEEYIQAVSGAEAEVR